MFIKHSRGSLRFYMGLLILSPILLLYQIGIIRNDIAKECVFKYFFRGMQEARFTHYCEQFVAKLNVQTNTIAVDHLKKAKESGNRVIIMSASPQLWITPWAKQYGAEVIGTELNTRDGIMTGAFASHNCYGVEKVKRLKQYLNAEREAVYIIAYGDSKGDIPILNYADEGYWVKNGSIIRYER